MRSPTMFFIASALAATLALTTSEARADKDEWGNEKGGGDDDDDAKKPAPKKQIEPPPAEGPWDIYDVEEKPGKSYFFVGAQYRGNIVPSFMINLFVDEGKTVYTNMIGAEFEYRKDGFSLIPGLSYHELGFDDFLFKEKSTPNIAGNYTVVSSGLKIMYAKMDILWSTKVHKNVEFEYGLGVGLGAVFGDLENNWVQEAPNGQLAADTGKRYDRCQIGGVPGSGCNKADHQNSPVDKVGGYQEKSWFNGGYKPSIFPWISVPQVGFRFKPMKNLVARFGLGFALTGFWFGLQAQYGLEQKPKP